MTGVKGGFEADDAVEIAGPDGVGVRQGPVPPRRRRPAGGGRAAHVRAARGDHPRGRAPRRPRRPPLSEPPGAADAARQHRGSVRRAVVARRRARRGAGAAGARVAGPGAVHAGVERHGRLPGQRPGAVVQHRAVARQRSPVTPVDPEAARRRPRAYLALQALVAALCWATLAASVWTVVGRPLGAVRWPPARSSRSRSPTPVAMWDQSALSESLAVSLLAAAGGGRGSGGGPARRRSRSSRCWRRSPCGCRCGTARPSWRRGRGRRAGGRPGGGRGCGPGAAGRSSPGRPGARRLAGPGALGALVLGLPATLAASTTASATCTRCATCSRSGCCPTRTGSRWFADHGMPQAGEFLGPGAAAPVRGAGPGAGRLRPRRWPAATAWTWFAWLESDGRGTFARWVLTHPGYLVDRAAQAPERTFNNAGGDRGFYAPPDQRRVPLVDGLLALRSRRRRGRGGWWPGWTLGRRTLTPALVAGAGDRRAGRAPRPRGLAQRRDGDGPPPGGPGAPAPPRRAAHGDRALLPHAAPSRPPRRPCRPRPAAGYRPGMADETPLSIHHPEGIAVGGVVVIQEVFGVTEHIEDVCQRLADAGWLAVAPHLFWRTGDPSLPYDDFSQVMPHVGALTADGDPRRRRRRLRLHRRRRLPPRGAPGSWASAWAAPSPWWCGPSASSAPRSPTTAAASPRAGSGSRRWSRRRPAHGPVAGPVRRPGPEHPHRPGRRAGATRPPRPRCATEVIEYPDAGHAFNRDGGPSYHQASADRRLAPHARLVRRPPHRPAPPTVEPRR